MAANYSIRDLETLSGIKAHTIRIWEQRYHILKAHRTDTNIRVYTETELKYMMSLALLNRNGYKISKLAILSQAEISDLVEQMVNEPIEFHNQIESLTIAAIEYNEEKFDRILNTCILQMGFENTVKKIVFPFLEKIGLLWVSGTVIASQEHFMTNLLRQKFIVAIDGHPLQINSGSKTFLLFLPNSEWHELSLLFLNYLLRSSNHKVVYLGPSVPIDDVINAGESIKPDGFYTILTGQPNGYLIGDYLNKLANHFPASKVFVSGPQVMHPIKGLAPNVFILNDLNTVITQVEVFFEEK